MTPPQASEAAVGELLSRYTAAMIRGDLTTCISIEHNADVYGYPPEIVCAALRAIDEGQDPGFAVASYLSGDDLEATP